MPTTFRPYHPDQPHLLPPNPREWLPDGDLAYQIADLVDALDLAAFYAPYEGDGRRNSPYETGDDGQDPALRLRHRHLLLAPDRQRPAARPGLPAAGRRQPAPPPRTICEFRKRHLEDFKDLFVQVVRIARRDGTYQTGDPGGGRQQGAGLGLPAQGDELWAHAGAGAKAARRDRRPAGAGPRPPTWPRTSSTAPTARARTFRKSSNAADRACKR